MSFTMEQMRSIQDKLAKDGNVLPPLDVVRAVAVLIGKDNLSEVICDSYSDEKSTSWRVVGLLDSGCLFTVMAVGDEGDWDSGSFEDAEGRVKVELVARIRSLSDIASLNLTRATAPAYEPRRTPRNAPDQENKRWDVDAVWEICWRDDSPSLVLTTSTDEALLGTDRDLAAANSIVDSVRQVLAARQGAHGPNTATPAPIRPEPL
jgi:hypothetical protein